MQGLLLWFARCKRDYSPPAGRSGELFAQHLRQVQTRTDELLYYVLLIQYPAAIALALFWSPLAWVGSEKQHPSSRLAGGLFWRPSHQPARIPHPHEARNFAHPAGDHSGADAHGSTAYSSEWRAHRNAFSRLRILGVPRLLSRRASSGDRYCCRCSGSPRSRAAASRVRLRYNLPHVIGGSSNMHSGSYLRISS